MEVEALNITLISQSIEDFQTTMTRHYEDETHLFRCHSIQYLPQQNQYRAQYVQYHEL